MGTKVTAREVAQLAGVSAATVDRVLNGRGGVTPDKEKAVMKAARQLGLDRALNQRVARTLRIAVLAQPPSNPFHAAIARGFIAAPRLWPQYNLQFSIHHIDPAQPAQTARRIETLASSHDGLVILAEYEPRIAATLQSFGSSGKPVIAIATDLGAQIGVEPYFYVGPDNLRAGRMAGDLIARLLGREGGEIMIIAGMLSMNGHAERVAGCRAVLAERHPQCRVTEVVESLEKPERAGALVFRALRDTPGLRAIYNASAGAQTVVEALRRVGRQDVVFVTHELTDERRNLLQQGLIDAILDQDPMHEVRVTVETIAAHFGRTDAHPESTITPVHIHMIENC